MKLSVLGVVLALTFAPSAHSFPGVIRTNATVAGSCSVDSVDIKLTRNGSRQLRGSDTLDLSQTGDTKWTISKTQINKGSGFTPHIEIQGFSNLNIKSTNASSQAVTVKGKHSGKADVTAILDAAGGFDPGDYQTLTTFICEVL